MCINYATRVVELYAGGKPESFGLEAAGLPHGVPELERCPAEHQLVPARHHAGVAASHRRLRVTNAE
jgi:hypothetical protein